MFKMKFTTKLGLASGLIISLGSVLHTDLNLIKEKPLETIIACTVITTAMVGTARLSEYIGDITIGKLGSKAKQYFLKKYNLTEDKFQNAINRYKDEINRYI